MHEPNGGGVQARACCVELSLGHVDAGDACEATIQPAETKFDQVPVTAREVEQIDRPFQLIGGRFRNADEHVVGRLPLHRGVAGPLRARGARQPRVELPQLLAPLLRRSRLATEQPYAELRTHQLFSTRGSSRAGEEARRGNVHVVHTSTTTRYRAILTLLTSPRRRGAARIESAVFKAAL